MTTPNEPNAKSQYLLLFRGIDWDQSMSPAEIQKVMTAWSQWFSSLKAEGKLKAGQPLQPTGKVVTGKSRTVADGPFAEAKEAIGGYFLLEVDSEEEAVAIARQAPPLEYGMIVEVRPVAPECPMMERVRQFSEAELAGAGA